MKITLRVLNSKDYDKLSEKYPKKIRPRILNSWGFADKSIGAAFVRQRKNMGEMKLTALHEIDELISKISPHEELGLRFKDKGTQPSIQYTQSPEAKDLYENYTKPFTQEQFDLYRNLYEPGIRQLGGQLSQDLTQPFQLPQDVWDKVWQQGRERTLSQYAPIERAQTQRFASTGALDNSGQVNKFFGDLELSKAKSIEDLAVEQAIQEWTQKTQAKQQAISNYGNFLQSSPTLQSFGYNIPGQDTVLTGGSRSNQGQYAGLTGAAGAVGAGFLSGWNPEMMKVGYGVGSGVGQTF